MALCHSSSIRELLLVPASGGTASFNYDFDVVSRLKYEQRNGGTADGYSYDLADQILGFNRDGTLDQQSGTVSGGAEVMTLNFDANGNRTSTVDNNVNETYLTNALNQYTQDLNGTATYDTNGNLATTGDGWAYSHDAQNRLTNADQSSTNTHVIYYYDGLNRQVARDENGTRTYSVWDGWSMIQEYDGSGNLVNNYLQGAGTDEMVARFGTNNSNRIWYYQDGRGNTSNVADDSGALVETYTYDLGGKPFITTAPGKTSPGNRFLYNGRDYSSLTGLYDYRNRFYRHDISRFLQDDPAGFGGGSNLYRFCGNNAANAADPLGLQDDGQIQLKNAGDGSVQTEGTVNVSASDIPTREFPGDSFGYYEGGAPAGPDSPGGERFGYSIDRYGHATFSAHMGMGKNASSKSSQLGTNPGFSGTAGASSGSVNSGTFSISLGTLTPPPPDFGRGIDVTLGAGVAFAGTGEHVLAGNTYWLSNRGYYNIAFRGNKYVDGYVEAVRTSRFLGVTGRYLVGLQLLRSAYVIWKNPAHWQKPALDSGMALVVSLVLGALEYRATIS
jgi:RHS repeat-associated protein